jgi:hypothetical protein
MKHAFRFDPVGSPSAPGIGVIGQGLFDFDLQLFAQAPAAQKATVGVGAESVFGTPVTPTVFLIPSTWGFDGENDLLERNGARNRVGQSETLTGVFMGKGSMTAEIDPDSAGAIFLLAMGAEAFAANASNPGALAVSTTLLNAVSAGFGPATPASMVNIVKGQRLTIGTDTVLVRAVSATQFWAVFGTSHAASAAISNASVQLAYDHTFTLASPRKSATVQLNDVLSAKNCFGAKMSQLSFKLTPKQILEAQCQMAYQGEINVGSPTSPTFSTLRGFSFYTAGNGMTWNGVALDQAVQGASIDINIGLITDYPQLGQGRYQGNFPETTTKVTGSLDLAFESDTALQSFWGNIGSTGPQSDVLPVPLTFTFDSVDSVNTAVPYSLQFLIPMAKLKASPVVRKTGDYLKQTATFTASESSNSAGDDVKIILTNASNAASL